MGVGETMTLDEAITHARKVIERNKWAIDFEPEDSVDNDIKTNCLNCIEQHEQLVEYLEELKRRREYDGELTGSGALNNAYKNGYNKAIDEFANLLYHECLNSLYHEVHMFRVLKLAKLLKEGGE